MRARIGLILVAALLATGVATAADKDELIAADRAWAESDDSELSKSYWAEGASIHAPGTPTVTGVEQIGEFMGKLEAMPGYHLVWAPTKAVVSKSGELGYTVGSYEMTMNGPDGSPVVEKGTYLTVWVKQDGAWKVMEDIFNSDAPAPE